MDTVSVIIPVYNECQTLPLLLEKVLRVDLRPMKKQVILIDDGSTDGSRDILKRYEKVEGVVVCYHQKNRGKGAALKTGFEKIQDGIIIIQDADLEYDPQEYPKLIEPILKGDADVVYGSRFLSGTHRAGVFWHHLGNKFLTFLTNLVSNLYLTDAHTCYKVFCSDVFKKIYIRSNGFEFCPEFTMKVSRQNLRIYEIPISYHGRSYKEGKKIRWKDGLKTIFAIFRFRFFD